MKPSRMVSNIPHMVYMSNSLTLDLIFVLSCSACFASLTHHHNPRPISERGVTRLPKYLKVAGSGGIG